ncbi:MAG: GTP-binding protein, partial [Ghiorsea sp.]|nr:GTP-binding protein [Ghiorsea sp.]
MQIKVFSAPTMHQALALVREDFGSDAVILDRIEAVNAQGKKEWRVHAALDHELEGAVRRTSAPKPVVDDSVQSHLEASMLRLEKIAASLGNRDVEQYRQAIPKASVQIAFDHLLAMGVSATNAFEMADAYAKHQPVALATLRWAKPFSAKRERRVVLLSGPNGAGKTLLAAKLATHYSLKGISVALMTTDTQRIGGSEVLNAYADVLGIPLFIIRN